MESKVREKMNKGEEEGIKTRGNGKEPRGNEGKEEERRKYNKTKEKEK